MTDQDIIDRLKVAFPDTTIEVYGRLKYIIRPTHDEQFNWAAKTSVAHFFDNDLIDGLRIRSGTISRQPVGERIFLILEERKP